MGRRSRPAAGPETVALACSGDENVGSGSRAESIPGARMGILGGRPRQRDPRLPPGQYDVGDSFPVLTAEVSPRIDPADWTFRIDGLVDTATTWSWAEIRKLPPSTYSGDIHCVTTWSKLATSF